MKRTITLKYHKDVNNPYSDNTFNISATYGICFCEYETKDGYVMTFIIKEELNDNRTARYFEDLLCYIFDTEPTNYIYHPSGINEVSIYTIMLAFVDRIRWKYDDRHYKEVLKKWHKDECIEIVDSIPVIHKLNNGEYTLTPTANSIYGLSVYERIAPEKLKGKTQEQLITRGKNKRAVYRNFDFNDLYESCSLYRSFCDGEDFYDLQQVFNIARNICGAEKGKQHFLDIVNNQQANGPFISGIHWKEILNTIIKDNIPIASCDQCERCEYCQHSENMLSTAKPQKTEIRQTRKSKYYPIEEVSQELNDAFEQAINSQGQDIYIIKAQTGIGKTHTYLSYMKDTDRSLIIAVPTHSLKNEIMKQARDMGIDNICCTPDLNEYNLSDELCSKIKNFYKIGAGEYVLKFLTNQLKKLKKSDADYINISAYLSALKNSLRSKGHIITTHARLLRMNSETLENHTVIIDEDILKSSISTSSVSMNDLKAARKSGAFKSAIQNRLNYLCNNRGYHCLDGMYFPKDEDTLKRIEGINSNIIDLLSSEYVYIASDMVHYLTDSPLPRCKLIILSATANNRLYTMCFPDRIFHFHECHKAQYAGRIIQHTNCSYSGYILEKNPDMISRLYNSAMYDVIITFKSIEHEFMTHYHFGNVEGLNILGGKNLSVIGLPNKPDYVYCLYGMRAGVIIEKHPNMYTQRVTYNDYSFSLNTFKDKVLQTIQMWILSSQLEQAVGRARLLRNNCTVTVYAGFPVEQAEFHC